MSIDFSTRVRRRRRTRAGLRWLFLALAITAALAALRPADSAPPRISLNTAVSFPADI